MKKRLTVILLSISLAAISLNGCGKAERRADKDIARKWENESAVHGEVSKVTEDTITIKVAESGMAPTADLQLTGEEQEITVTKDTLIQRRNMRGMPENGDAPKPSDGGQGTEHGEAPAKPDGEQGTENGEAPAKPDGGQGMEEGEMPQMPEGEAPAGEIPDRVDHSEEITVSDISVGDIVMVMFTDDNHAAEITVMPSMGSGEKGEAPKSEEVNQAGTTV